MIQYTCKDNLTCYIGYKASNGIKALYIIETKMEVNI